mgnify:CR=1 FL=1
MAGKGRLRWVEGAGEVARNASGSVRVGGMSIGTLVTWFVIPSVYVLSAKDHRGEAVKARAEPDLGSSGVLPAEGAHAAE